MNAAEKYFSRAVESIQGEEYPIISFINMIIYAEAYRSLGIGDYQTAGKKIALQLLDEYASGYVINRKTLLYFLQNLPKIK